MSNDLADLEARIDEHLRLTNASADDANIARVAGALGESPGDVAAVLDESGDAAGDEGEEGPATAETPEIGAEEGRGAVDAEPEPHPAPPQDALDNPRVDEVVDPAWTDAESFDDLDWTETNADRYPADMLERERWMSGGGEDGKLPFAPWSTRNPDTECNSPDCPAERADDPECECDGRWKWSATEHYRTGDAVDGDRVFIQSNDGPHMLVDGDDVRDPETGDVHPEFIRILEALGMTYADVSTSGAGVHANYRGELPAGVKEATWDIDDRPWGSNDEPPAVEIYARKHVCLTTGDHVDGTPLEARDIDEDALTNVLDNAGELPDEDGHTDGERSSEPAVDEDYDPGATAKNQPTDDIRDVFSALDELDAKRVAERTIVDEWTHGRRSFLPTWGNSSSDSGTANYVDDEIWHDTGHDGGYGGPVVMAAIDAGLINHRGAEPSDVRGETWWKAVEHLRDELNCDIPRLVDDDDAVNEFMTADLREFVEETDANPYQDPDACLEACLRAREQEAVDPLADPPTLALVPIRRDGLNQDPLADMREGTRSMLTEWFDDLEPADFGGAIGEVSADE